MLSIGKEPQEIQIKEFDVSSMYQNASIVMIGKNDCPKSVLEHYKNMRSCYVITRDDLSKQIYEDIFPNVIMHNYENMNIFEEILEHQKETKITGQFEQIMLVLDYRKYDGIDSLILSKNKNLMEILFNSRHYNITYIMMIPIITHLSPTIRSNFDYVFIGDTDNISEQKKIYNYYAGMFTTFNSFMEVYVQIMKSNSLVVLDRRHNGIIREISDNVFWL